MITNNFKAFLREIGLFIGNSNSVGLLPVRDTRDNVLYYAPYSSGGFPNSTSSSYSTNMNTAGIKLGSGTTAPTADDYTLENPITSGLTVNVLVSMGISNDIPHTEFILTIQNTSSTDININEIGYVQDLFTSTVQKGKSWITRSFLWDRTVLQNTLTIAAGDYATLRYTITSAEV